ncbi:hypothetical protein [Thalassobacillus devorans]|nr:hypothetical protein [Thalassobacillus devorans]
MRELVGNCSKCGKNVYCEDGFLNGYYENKQLYCNDCYENAEDQDK